MVTPCGDYIRMKKRIQDYLIICMIFQNHPILKNLELDFCGKDGKALDTIIFAGENGTGKSTIINVLYEVASHTVKHLVLVEFEYNRKVFNISYYLKEQTNGKTFMYVNDGQGMNVYIGADDIKNRYPFSGIFSDVDINFHAGDVSTVTSLTLDSIKDSRRSTEKLPTQINQLLVDIQSMDDGELAYAYRTARALNKSVDDIVYQERMPRFTTAFNKMFEDLTYSRIENVKGKKSILFNNLSSGEKQVVYRGCFLLKDVNATNGAFVFIDEPEISLHPNWQAKVMDYYKGIFTNCGEQTSQIFAVTHSPFIIHNDTRRNDSNGVHCYNDICKQRCFSKEGYLTDVYCNWDISRNYYLTIYYYVEIPAAGERHLPPIGIFDET